RPRFGLGGDYGLALSRGSDGLRSTSAYRAAPRIGSFAAHIRGRDHRGHAPARERASRRSAGDCLWAAHQARSTAAGIVSLGGAVLSNRALSRGGRRVSTHACTRPNPTTAAAGIG